MCLCLHTRAQHRAIQHSITEGELLGQGKEPVEDALDPRAATLTPIPTDPKRSPQSLIAPRRESPQQSKAAPRRAGPYEVGVAGSRGIGRGAPEDAFVLKRINFLTL